MKDLKETLNYIFSQSWIAILISFLSWIYFKAFYNELGAVYEYKISTALLDVFTFFVQNFNIDKAASALEEMTSFWILFFSLVFGIISVTVFTFYFNEEKKNSTGIATLLIWLSVLATIFAGLRISFAQDYLIYPITFLNFIFVSGMTSNMGKTQEVAKLSRVYSFVMVVLYAGSVLLIFKFYQIASVQDAKTFMESSYKNQLRVCVTGKGCGHFVNENEGYICIKIFDAKKIKCFKKGDDYEVVYKSDLHD